MKHAIAALSMILFAAIPAGAIVEAANQYDINIAVQRFDAYARNVLDPSSPVTRAQVTVNSQGATSNGDVYEQLWYVGKNSMGCHRQKDLKLPQHAEVTIRVIPEDGSGDIAGSAAAANAVLRVFLDARLCDSYVKAIVVPQVMFDGLIGELKNYRFYQVDDERLDQDQQQVVALTIKTDSDVREETLYFGGR